MIALMAAIEWVVSLATGPLAVAVCVLSIAVLGLLMLDGRLSVKRTAHIVLGCFIIFGAPVIANGFVDRTYSSSQASLPFAPVPVYRPNVPSPNPFDPYAGASVPNTLENPTSGIIR